MLQIKLLGECSLVWDGQPIAGLGSDRLQALVAYLALHHHAPQARQRVAFQLWPDSTDTQARANLRKELSYLRRALPDPDAVLWVDTKMLQWRLGPECWLDVVAFESLIKAAEQATDGESRRSHLEQALELYRDDLLPLCDQEWIGPERERLRHMQGRALGLLIDQLEHQRDYRAAIAQGQRLLRLDPLNEATYGLLMRLYGLSGDRANALQLYHRCMTVLRDELGIDPGPAMRQLYERLLADDAVVEAEPRVEPLVETSPARRMMSPMPGRASLTPLVGRDREWATVQQWIATAPTDRPLLVLVGEPGIGKTRLLQEVQDTMQGDAQTVVLWGRGFEAEIVRPYGVWMDALRSLMAQTAQPLPPELGVLLPELGASGETPVDRSRLFDGVVQWLAQLAIAPQSVVIILDDVQWIDEASSALLHYALRLLNGLPVWMACTARAKELEENAAVMHVLQALRRERRLHTLTLAPLAADQTAELVRQVHPGVMGTDGPPLTDRIVVESGGNPLFALELARALAYGEPSHADNLDLLICDRLQRLDDAARELIPWAAALGQRFKPTLVAQVADYPLAKLLLAVEHLEREAIIRASATDRDEMSYDFAHDIVRQVAYRQLSEPRRRLVHLQIAHQLQSLAATQPDLVADVAHHAALGGDRALAASAALAAAERSLKVFAYAEAAELAQRGIQHCQGLDDRSRIRLHLGLLRVLVIAGVTGDRIAPLEGEVQQLMTQARTLGLAEDEATGYEVLLILHFDHENVVGLQQSSLRAVEASRAASPATTARMLAYGGSCLAEIGRDMARAEALLLEAQSLAARVGLQLTDIPCGLGCVYRYKGDYAEARRLLQQAWHMTQAEQDHWRECSALGYLAMTELEDGHPAAALPYCDEMARVAASMKGEGSEGAIATALAALAHYCLDAATEAAELEQAIATLHQLDTKRMLAYVLLGAAQVDLTGDRPQLAHERAERALQAAQTVNQLSDVALAQAVLIQSTVAMGQCTATLDSGLDALRQAVTPSDHRQPLSWRSRTVIEQVLQRVQPLPSSRRC